MGKVDEGRRIDYSGPQQLFLVQREEHEEPETQGGQCADGLLLVFGELLLFEEFNNLSFDCAWIIPRREGEDARKTGKEGMATKIRAHNGDDELSVLQRVT